MKRLTDANHFAGSSQTSSQTDTEQGIDYDLNGNMTVLKRYNASGLENDLSFLHTGNRMTSLTDANAVGSDSGAKSFTYDANGNLTHDGRKDLDIQWNIFNLASGAVTHDGSLTYARLSDGTLISSQNVSGNTTTGKRYCGSFVYATGTGITTPQVESIAWDEGRIFRDAQTGTYRDCWFAGDHLGDVRSVVDISPNLSSPVVLEQNDYLPLGTKIANSLHAQMTANRWRYAGKEEFPEVEMLDFGARMYDPFIARWTANDPMAGRYFHLSPFVYCYGNPLRYADPDGCDGWDKTMGFFIGTITNIIPGSGNLRDLYSPHDSQDYNGTLESCDKAAVLVGDAMQKTGTLMTGTGAAVTGAGLGMMGAGGVLAISGGGIVVFAGGAKVAVTGVKATMAGVTTAVAGLGLMMNASNNRSEGYKRGGSKSSNCRDNGKNEKHGDRGRELSKTEKQRDELQERMNNTPTKKERKELQIKLKHIIENAERKAKGEEHSRGGKR